MHPAQIQAAMAMAGYTQAALARELGLASNTVSAVVKGRGRSAQVEARIAEITGHTLEELWPQWHGKPPLVLSDDERALVLLYRELPTAQRKQVLPTVREMSKAERGGKAPAGVTVQGGIRSAGRDYHEGESGGRKKR